LAARRFPPPWFVEETRRAGADVAAVSGEHPQAKLDLTVPRSGLQ
jgi:hypothetical protein